MPEDNESLIEMPDKLYKNPPEPRRKDIADLFEKIIHDKENQNIFDEPTIKKLELEHTFNFRRFNNDNHYKIYQSKNLIGIININEYLIYKTLTEIIYYLQSRLIKKIVIYNPEDSQKINRILRWIDKDNIKKVTIFIIEKDKNIILKMVLE